MLNMILSRTDNRSGINIYDVAYIFIIIIASVFLIYSGRVFVSGKGSRAIVKYNNREIIALDLSRNQTVILKRRNYPLLLDDMIIEVKNRKVAVIKEKSPYNYCSLMGFTDSVTRPIICQPNKVTVIIETDDKNSENTDVDAEVR